MDYLYVSFKLNLTEVARPPTAFLMLFFSVPEGEVKDAPEATLVL